jgi:hypothetical protein
MGALYLLKPTETHAITHQSLMTVYQLRHSPSGNSKPFLIPYNLAKHRDHEFYPEASRHTCSLADRLLSVTSRPRPSGLRYRSE